MLWDLSEDKQITVTGDYNLFYSTGLQFEGYDSTVELSVCGSNIDYDLLEYSPSTILDDNVVYYWSGDDHFSVYSVEEPYGIHIMFSMTWDDSLIVVTI